MLQIGDGKKFRIAEDRACKLEGNTMLAHVGSGLAFVPLELKLPPIPTRYPVQCYSMTVRGVSLSPLPVWSGAGQGNFKTRTLREIARTAPYMHDGSIATLEDVIEYYDRGGNRNSGLDAELHPLRLTPGEKHALAAYLRSLNGVVSQSSR